MKKFLAKNLYGIVVVSVLVSPAFADEKTFDVSGFTGVDSSAGVNVDVSVGSDFSVRATSSEKGLERLSVEVKGDTLHIGRQWRNNWGRSPSVQVAVTMPKLESLEASSGSSIDADGVIASDFNIDASSGATIVVEGSCDDVEIDVSSGASIDAEDLKCSKVVADGSSGGSISAAAATKLVAEASSGSSIRVYGSPEYVDIDKSSGGSVKIKN